MVLFKVGVKKTLVEIIIISYLNLSSSLSVSKIVGSKFDLVIFKKNHMNNK